MGWRGRKVRITVQTVQQVIGKRIAVKEETAYEKPRFVCKGDDLVYLG